MSCVGTTLKFNTSYGSGYSCMGDMKYTHSFTLSGGLQVPRMVTWYVNKLITSIHTLFC